MRLPLVTCPACACFRRPGEGACPQCGAPAGLPLTPVAAALLAGLVLGGGCGGAVPKYGIAPEYGVFDSGIDADGDGWTLADGDCDDDDPDVHPDAEETPGDGVDQNCDGEDDT